MVHKPDCRLLAAFDHHGEHPGTSLGQILLGQGVVLVPRQGGVAHRFHHLRAQQVLRNLFGVGAVPVHAHRQRLQPHVEQEGVDGTGVHSEVPHQLYAGLGDIGRRPKVSQIPNAVVALIRLGQLREFAVVPGEFAAVHNHAAHL